VLGADTAQRTRNVPHHEIAKRCGVIHVIYETKRPDSSPPCLTAQTPPSNPPEEQTMKKILLVAAMLAVGAAHGANANKLPLPFLEFPGSYEGEWCALDNGDDPAEKNTYAHHACDDPPGRIIIAADTLSERDDACRLIDASSIGPVSMDNLWTVSIDARLHCRSRKGEGHQGQFDIRERFIFKPDKDSNADKDQLTIEYIR
jgi:hypothetical protein